ncbi:MAG TPA: hypothetical protein VL728_04010 [Cyclobacteriaceae bacterium]|jgi:hypothetical protein|nr:hypothetical protein [Cyclobacteriaceae bacterium]
MSNVKTVAAFEELVSRCSGYGGYNPGSPNLQLNVINAIPAQAREALQSVKVAKTDYEKATNDREIAFNAMKRLCPQVVSALKAVRATKQTVADARAMVRSMTGFKAADRKPVETPASAALIEPAKKGMSGLPKNFEALAEYFAKLVQTVSTVEQYTPNEEYLSLASLQAMLDHLREMNRNVIETKARLGKARGQRNDLFYTADGNLCDIARTVKDYVKSVYGPSSDQYKQLVKISFNKIKK